MKFKAKKSLSLFLIALVIVAAIFNFYSGRVDAGLAASASNQLSDPRPSNAGTTYTTTFTTSGTTSIQCIVIIFADATGHIVTSANPSTTAPAGMTTTSAVKGTVSGGGLTNANWSLYGSAANGILQYEYSTGGTTSTGTPVAITTTTITNPSAATFYVQVATYSTLTTHTCSGIVDTSNIMANVTTGGVATSVTVDPTLSFSVAGYSSAVNSAPAPNLITTASSIAFGNVSAGGSATEAAQLLTTSTNAAHGYSIYIRDTQALTNAATNTIRDNAGTPASPNSSFDGSTSQSSFGFTTDSTTVSMATTKFAGLTQTNAAIDTQTTPQNATALHVEYELELSNVQPPGTYSNIITYTATPTY